METSMEFVDERITKRNLLRFCSGRINIWKNRRSKRRNTFLIEIYMNLILEEQK